MTYDITYGPGPNDVDITAHFCREWEGDKGCYGTNPDHGFTWEEAREEVAAWFDAQAAYWRSRTEAEHFPPMVMDDELPPQSESK